MCGGSTLINRVATRLVWQRSGRGKRFLSQSVADFVDMLQAPEVCLPVHLFSTITAGFKSVHNRHHSFSAVFLALLPLRMNINNTVSTENRPPHTISAILHQGTDLYSVIFCPLVITSFPPVASPSASFCQNPSELLTA